MTVRIPVAYFFWVGGMEAIFHPENGGTPLIMVVPP